MAVDLAELTPQAAGRIGRVELGLDDDAPPDDVQPPANLNVAATSALRQHGLVTTCLLSSSFTFAVIAMAVILPRVTERVVA